MAETFVAFLSPTICIFAWNAGGCQIASVRDGMVCLGFVIGNRKSVTDMQTIIRKNNRRYYISISVIIIAQLIY